MIPTCRAPKYLPEPLKGRARRLLATARRYRLRGDAYAAALYLNKAARYTRDAIACRNVRD